MHHLSRRHSVKTNDRHIFRHSNPSSLSYIQAGKRRQITAEYPVDIRMTAEDLFGYLIIGFPVEYVPLHDLLQYRNSMLLQDLSEGGVSVICQNLGRYTRDNEYFLTPCRKHQLCRHLSAFRVIAADQRDLRAQVAVNGHDRLCLLPVFFHLKAVGRRDDPIHHVPLKHVQILLLPSADAHCITDHRLISLFIQFHLYILHQRRKERMIQIRHDHAHDSRLIMIQIPCQFIRGIIELLRRLLYLLSRLR